MSNSIFKKSIIFFLALGMGSICRAQNDSESYKVYEIVLAKLTKRFTTLEKATTLRAIKHFNFKDPSIYWVVPEGPVSDDWHMFLNSIDTAKLKTEPLADAFCAKHPFELTARNYLRFSPVIFSGDKAMVGLYIYNAGMFNEQVFLLEKKSGDWTIYKRIVVDM
ncbi:MAG: hypothetical protein V4553_05260 [Bacteroidota bacterium]